MSGGPIRDVSPFLQMLRNFLLGRNFVRNLRFTDELATRSPPLPNLPDGPSHRLSENYYYSRDGRRMVKPPLLIFGGQKKLESQPETKVIAAGKVPGKIHNWDS